MNITNTVDARYLELRYLELSLSRTNYLVPYTAFRSLSRTFVRIFKLEHSVRTMFAFFHRVFSLFQHGSQKKVGC